MYKCRPLSLSRIIDCALHRVVARKEVAAVNLLDEEIGERAYQLGDAAAGGVDLDRDRNRVAVVFDEINCRQLEIAGSVEGLPKLPFARLTFTSGDQYDLILLETFGDAQQLRPQRRLGGSDALEELSSSRRGSRDDIVFLVSPVAGHLASARRGIDCRSNRLI